MNTFHRRSKRAVKGLLAGVLCLLLAACDLPSLPGGGNGPKVDTSKAVRVGLLVPLGSGDGNLEALGNSLVKAARLAVKDLGPGVIDLKVYSTAGNANRASAVAKQAVNEGAKILVGPLFAEAANAAGNAVSGQSVSVLSFSNNTQIAGGNVFVLGNTFQNTADRIVGYAARRGYRNIAVVAKQDLVGEIGANAVRTAAARSGANFTGISTYTFPAANVVAAIPRIVANVKGTGSNAVVFTADNAGALPLLAQLLPEAGLSNASVKFLGLTRWDLPAQALSQPGLQGGWFAIPDTGVYAGFRSRYRAAYGGEPHPLAGYSYDGVAAVGALLKSGSSSALSRRKLTQRKGFAGVNGVFRLNADGSNQRALAVAEIRNGRVAVVDPAPRSFRAGGF